MQIVRAGGAQFEVEQSGSGPDLLLLHSLLTDPGSFAAIVPALSRGRRVTLVSLPGFGRSTAAGPSIEDSADRLAHLLSALGGKPDVLGNGYGGFIAVALAARHGAKLGKLVLADTGAAFPEAGRAPFRAIAVACRALAEVDLRPQLPRIANPTLVVVGKLDAATPPVLARELVAGIPGAKLVELPECGHCPPLQQPVPFVASVAHFLGVEA